MIDDPMALNWWKTARIAECPWLAPSPDAPLKRGAQYPEIEKTDSRDDVEYCRAQVEARGMEFLVLDQTRHGPPQAPPGRIRPEPRAGHRVRR